MDWTGGARRRFAQREDTVVQKQRAHFASVRAAQNAAQERQPEPRGAAIGKQPIANLDAEAGLIRSHTQAAYVATRQQAGPTTCPSAEDELLLIQRRRLLAKPDWPGIATARPVRMRFPSVAEKDRIGKRRRVESKPMEDAAQTPSSAMFMSEVDSTVNFKVGTEALKSQTVTMPKSTVVGTSLRHMSGPVIGPSSLYLKRAQEADLPSISRRSPVDHLSDMPTSHRNVSSDLESISEESMLLGDDGDQSELNLKKMSLVQSAAPQVPQMFSHHGTTSMPFEWSSTIHDAVEDKPLRHFQNEEEHGELSALLKSKAGIVHPSPELSIEEVIAARGLNDQTRRIENWRHKSCTQLGISAICRYSGSPSKFDQDRADLHLEVADGISGSGARRTREEQAVHNPSGTRGNDTHTLSTPHIPRTTANCNVANPSENPTISQRCHNLAPSTSAVSHFHIRVGESGLHEQSRCMIDLRAENGTFNLLRATNKTPMELSVHSKEEEPRRRPLGVRDYPNTVQYGADGFSTLPQNELDMVDDSKSRMSTAERQPEGMTETDRIEVGMDAKPEQPLKKSTGIEINPRAGPRALEGVLAPQEHANLSPRASDARHNHGIETAFNNEGTSTGRYQSQKNAAVKQPSRAPEPNPEPDLKLEPIEGRVLRASSTISSPTVSQYFNTSRANTDFLSEVQEHSRNDISADYFADNLSLGHITSQTTQQGQPNQDPDHTIKQHMVETEDEETFWRKLMKISTNTISSTSNANEPQLDETVNEHVGTSEELNPVYWNDQSLQQIGFGEEALASEVSVFTISGLGTSDIATVGS